MKKRATIFLVVAAIMVIIKVFEGPLARLLGALLDIIIAMIQGLLGYDLPKDPSAAGPLDLIAEALVPLIFLVGLFLIISFSYYLFFARGRSFGEILRIERLGQTGQVEAGRSDKQKEMLANWKLVSRIIVAELILIFVGSFIFSAVQTAKYSTLNYKKYSFGSYQSFSRDAPMYYSFVMVKNDPDGKPVREVFFASLGNITTVSYKDGKWISSGGGMLISSILFVIAGFLGVGSVIIANFIIMFSRSEGQSEKAKRLMFYGVHILIATLPVMAVMSVLGYLVDILLHNF